MYPLSVSPIKEIPFGDALNITLDNYYDLLKANIGGLAAEEYLQLKLVADIIDLSPDVNASVGGYKWFSYYNLLNRSDRSVLPTPVSGGVQTSVIDLSDIYGKFLRRLRAYVVQQELSPEDQKKIADIDVTLESLKDDAKSYAKLDRQNWKEEAEAMGYNRGDMTAYVQWSSLYGHLRDIEVIVRRIQSEEFKKKTILDRQYPNPDDRAIIEAEFNYENPAMRLRYPTNGDFDYPNGDSFNLTYLALLPLGSTALFDDRRAVSWNMTMNTMKTSGAGSFTAMLDRNTQESKSIETDWKTSGSGSYGLFSAKASVSEHKKITEDFKKGKEITLGCKAAFKVGIKYQGWFDASLFEHKHVKENIRDFEDFFGPAGSLLYYPTELIFIRGFSLSFQSTQNWVYDYKKNFSASGGGGFSGVGFSFGGSASYSKNVKEHKVDQSNTTLTISDDVDTIRFVGYAVKKNTVFQEQVESNLSGLIPGEVEETFE